MWNCNINKEHSLYRKHSEQSCRIQRSWNNFGRNDILCLKIFAHCDKYVTLQPTKPVMPVAMLGVAAWTGQGGSINIDGIQRSTEPFVGLTNGERRFLTLLSVNSNFSNLNHRTEVMQLKRLRGCIISLTIYEWLCLWCSVVNRICCIYYHSAWAGLRCLSLHRGNAKAREQG